MKLSLCYGESVLTLPGRVLELLPNVGEVEIKVLIKLTALCTGASGKGEINPAELAAELNLSAGDVQGVIEFWRGAGLLKKDASAEGMQSSAETAYAANGKSAAHPTAALDIHGKNDSAEPTESSVQGVQVNRRKGSSGAGLTVVQGDEIPHYTADEIKRIFSENAQLSGMIDECQNILGKLFTPTEVNKLLALTDYYRLDCEYVTLLCYHCKKAGRVSVPYVDKLAKSLWQEGIVTSEALEARLSVMDAAADLGNYFRQLSGAGGRSFTEKEMKFFTQWSKWQVKPEVLKLAYEVAVDNTGSPSMPYINKVLSNWQDAGYRTPEEVVAAMEAYKQKKEAKNSGGTFSSFDTDEFFEAALNRTLELHKNLTEQKK